MDTLPIRDAITTLQADQQSEEVAAVVGILRLLATASRLAEAQKLSKLARQAAAHESILQFIPPDSVHALHTFSRIPANQTHIIAACNSFQKAVPALWLACREYQKSGYAIPVELQQFAGTCAGRARAVFTSLSHHEFEAPNDALEARDTEWMTTGSCYDRPACRLRPSYATS